MARSGATPYPDIGQPGRESRIRIARLWSNLAWRALRLVSVEIPGACASPRVAEIVVSVVVLVGILVEGLPGQRRVETHLDELGVIRVEIAPTGAWIVVIVHHQQRPGIENQHALDGDE